jgi:hypothetical protein
MLSTVFLLLYAYFDFRYRTLAGAHRIACGFSARNNKAYPIGAASYIRYRIADTLYE